MDGRDRTERRSRVRACAVAGYFYPEDPTTVHESARALLDQALADHPLPGAVATSIDEDAAGAGSPEAASAAPKAIIAPHAGWLYSGDLAALAWSRFAPLKGTVRRVVLLGPTHRVPVRGAALPDADVFDTPIGPLPVPVDEVLERTRGLRIPVSVNAATHRDEHALEVQAPFLRLVLGEVELVPFNVGGADASEVADLIEALWDDDETVIAVSSDLSHYHPASEAHRIDADTIGRILSLDGEVDHARACGATPLAGLLEVCRRRRLRPELLGAHHSGDVTGDASRVVGYAAFEIRESR